MSELSAAEVCTAGNGGARKFQAWRTLMSWFSFVFQILWQIVKGTPPFAQVLSFLGDRHPLLSSSPSFKLLPVDSRAEALPPVREADTAAVGRLKVCGSIGRIACSLYLDGYCINSIQLRRL
ncbi:hypothetical protein KSP40_PGU016556 [Platanthera guangdongensis]|uniref:Uncharacterized protein n=1 Tax=Platanthera guangdongensis TaxID=2320717 RepID=A0ABR2M8R3_9ASPA